MKVKAKHNINYGGKRIAGGEVFEAAETELDALREYVDPVGYVSSVFPPDSVEEKPKKPTRSRKKKEQ